MKILITIISLIAISVSGLWAYESDFTYEPITVFLFGLVGLGSLLIKPIWNKASTNEPVNSQEMNVTVNLGEKEEPEKTKTLPDSKKNDEFTRDQKIDLMKSKLSVLFIDDDKKFQVVKILKDAHWKRTKAVDDIKGLDIPAVKDADVFFVDINGVGKLLDCPHEGLDLALMIKEKYPERKVVIYSAVPKNNAFHKAWDLCDYKLEKNALPYQFQKLVEQYSLELFSK